MTFASLFALSVLGVSAVGWFRHVLRGWGAPWYCWLILPMLLVAMLSRKESEWLPDAEERRRCARWLVIGSIVLAVIMAKLAPDRPEVAKPAGAPQGRAGVRHP